MSVLESDRPAVLSERLPKEEYGVDSSCSWSPSRMARVLPAFLGSEYTKSSLQAGQDLLRCLQHSCAKNRHVLSVAQRPAKALNCH